jgi:membrane protein
MVGRGCFKQVGDSNLALISAGVAFFSMLSVFPALAALIALFGLISDPAVVSAQLEEVKVLLPEDVYALINAQVTGLITTSSDKLSWAGIISVLIALWTARAGVSAMMVGLNAVYGEPDPNAVWQYLKAFFLTIVLVCVGIVALLVVVVAPVVLAFFPLSGSGFVLIEVLRWVLAVVVLFIGVGLLYRYGPNRRGARVGWLTPGSTMAVISWVAVSVAFSYYVANFGNYNQVYGSIGAVIAMLVWLWIGSFLVLIGASLNAQLEICTHPKSTL